MNIIFDIKDESGTVVEFYGKKYKGPCKIIITDSKKTKELVNILKDLNITEYTVITEDKTKKKNLQQYKKSFLASVNGRTQVSFKL